MYILYSTCVRTAVRDSHILCIRLHIYGVPAGDGRFAHSRFAHLPIRPLPIRPLEAALEVALLQNNSLFIKITQNTLKSMKMLPYTVSYHSTPSYYTVFYIIISSTSTILYAYCCKEPCSVCLECVYCRNEQLQ